MDIDHDAIREAGRRIAAESLLDDPLPPLDRDLVGASSVQIRIPLRDPQQFKQHARMLITTLEQCILHVDRGAPKDRSILMDVRGRINLVAKKINCFRLKARL